MELHLEHVKSISLSFLPNYYTKNDKPIRQTSSYQGSELNSQIVELI